MDEDFIADENPATRLWELLTEWRVSGPGVMIYEQRGGSGDFWEQSVEAVHWCDLVADQVEFQGESDSRIEQEMRPILGQCRSAIFSLENAMTAAPNVTREHISESSLLALRFFARSWRPVKLEAEAAAEVLDLVRRLRDLVVKAEDIGPDAKDYISRLAINIEATLTANRIWGTVDLEDQSLQLAAAVQAFVISGEGVNDETKTESKPLLVRLQKRLSTTFWVDVVPKMIGASWDAGQKALEQGPPHGG